MDYHRDVKMSIRRNGVMVVALLGLAACKGVTCDAGTHEVGGTCAADTEVPDAPDAPTITTSIDTYSLDVTLTVEVAPGTFTDLSIQRRVGDAPWLDLGDPVTDATAVLTDSPPRGFDVAYRARATLEAMDDTGSRSLESPWSDESSETIVPLQGVPISWALDADGDDDLDNDDLEAAMDVCYGLGG